jgi:hypothetical protein
MALKREHFFGLVDPAKGTETEGREGQVMFLADAEREWVPITPVIDMALAREIAARANRSAGLLLRRAEIQIESLQKCLDLRETSSKVL